MSWAVALSSGMVLVAAGVLGALVWVVTPGSQEPSPAGATAAEVSQTLYVDAHQVRVDPVQVSLPEPHIPTGGVVAAQMCVPGQDMVSGQVAARISGQTVVALATSEPLWRDLAPGARGSDVAALQGELARLGYLAADADGIFGPATARAVKALKSATGQDARDGSLAVSSVMWLAQPTQPLATCEIAVGDTVDVGARYATVPGGLSALRVALPLSVSAGPHVLTLGEQHASIDDEGMVTDPDFLAAVQASDDYGYWVASGASATTPLMMAVQLAQPIEGVLVPPSALFGVAGSRGCILVGGVAEPVTVIASELGRSIVTFDSGATPSHVDIDPARTVTTCG